MKKRITCKSFKCIFLIILLINLVSCSSAKNTNYFSIKASEDFETNQKSEITFYDDSFKKVTTKNINSGGYYPYIEKNNKFYIFGGKNILSIDKKTKELKEFTDIIDYGIIEGIDNQKDGITFINNVGFISETEYNSEICEIIDLDNPEVKSFKSNNSLALTAIKENNKYYVISRSGFGGKVESKRNIEVYDIDGKFLYKKEIENPSSIYKFYRKDNDIYVLGMDSKKKVFKFDLEKEEISKEPIIDEENGRLFVNEGNETLYFFTENEIFEVDIKNKQLIPIFKLEDYYENFIKEDFLMSPQFTNNNITIDVYKYLEDGSDYDLEDIFIGSTIDLDFKKIEEDSFKENTQMSIFIGDLE